MSDLADRILEDLRGFAEELLERGLAPGRTASLGVGSSHTLSGVLRAVETLERLMPSLLAELDVQEDPLQTVLHSVRTPVRARLSHRPGDYDRFEGKMVPRVWTREVPVLVRDTEPLRWLLHVRDVLSAELARVAQRYAKWIDDAAISRQGNSEHAQHESDELDAIEARIAERRERLERIRGQIRHAARAPITSRASAPRTLPTSSSWSAVRRLAMEITRSGIRLDSQLAEILAPPVQIADLPFLYQRWCGMKMVQALEALGWDRTSDVLGPLFLGGCISFAADGLVIEMWVEPRLTDAGDHACGLRTARGEATPDFVLSTPGVHPLGGRAQTGPVLRGRDFFVLDPTLSTDPTVLSAKARYLSLLMSTDIRLIAGSPAYAGPLRSWAAAPLDAQVAKLFPIRDAGSAGAVPMHPAHWNAGPLQAWLGDIAAHARAWGMRAGE